MNLNVNGMNDSQFRRATSALSRVTPNNVSGLPRYIVRGYTIQCLCTARSTAETLSPYCPGQFGYNVCTAPQMRGNAGTMYPHCPQMRGSEETMYGVTPNNVTGQLQYIVRGYLRQCRGRTFCLPQLNY